MKTGIELIAKEREEQFKKHGRTIEDDVKYNERLQLSEAASTLATSYPLMSSEEALEYYPCPIGWDENIWSKMIRKPYKERLIIAGALIAAEIDRLNYSK